MVFYKKFFANNPDEAFTPSEKFKHPDTPVDIEVRNFNLGIADQQIIKDLSVTFPANKITCIVGPSGCGKSTLLRSLNRLTDSIEGVRISGDILLGNDKISGCSSAELVDFRRRVGLVPQRPTPLPMSIFNNVAYGCKIHGVGNRRLLRRTVRHYLKLVGLWDEVKDRLNDPASALSGGQQQRLCLARSLAVEPDFILADEVTSALDPISSKTVEDLFVKLKEKYSIIMVTHTLSQAMRIADNVVFLYLGEVIETGAAEKIFKNPDHDLTKKYMEGRI